MIGWSWDGTAPGTGGCGVHDDETRARETAEAWLRAHPGGRARFGLASLADGSTTLFAWWEYRGRLLQSRRMQDGRIVWARERQ